MEVGIVQEVFEFRLLPDGVSYSWEVFSRICGGNRWRSVRGDPGGVFVFRFEEGVCGYPYREVEPAVPVLELDVVGMLWDGKERKEGRYVYLVRLPGENPAREEERFLKYYGQVSRHWG